MYRTLIAQRYLYVLCRLRRDREVERLQDYQEVEFVLKPVEAQVR